MGGIKYNQKSRAIGDGAWQLQEAKACFSEVVRGERLALGYECALRAKKAAMRPSAAADLRGLCLATRHVADFEGTGVAVFNPWETDGGS